jgi:hypothetical protein
MVHRNDKVLALVRVKWESADNDIIVKEMSILAVNAILLIVYTVGILIA